ncbi:MAG: hypothetical protein MK086_12295 [Flavobacteriales bacterium]|nr:hypothetical protein [Flavobacteriales bacterium]
MKKSIKFITVLALSLILFIFITAFITAEPKPTEVIDAPSFESVLNIDRGKSFSTNWKSEVTFNHLPSADQPKEFYGQEIKFMGGFEIDRMLIGITNNLIARIEVWKGEELVEVKEKGFVGKMSWGESQSMIIDYYGDEERQQKNRIAMRFNGGSSFFGDIATIQYDLSKYEGFKEAREVSLFAKSLESEMNRSPEFSRFSFWQGTNSMD